MGCGGSPRVSARWSKQTIKGFPIILVDNGSSDGSVAFVRASFPAVRVIELGRNTGFARAVNVGIAAATTPYVALLNTDTEVHADWLAQLVGCIERASPEVAAVSPQMLMMDDPTRIDDAGDELSWYGAATKRGHGEPAADYDEASRDLLAFGRGVALPAQFFESGSAVLMRPSSPISKTSISACVGA